MVCQSRSDSTLDACSAIEKFLELIGNICILHLKKVSYSKISAPTNNFLPFSRLLPKVYYDSLCFLNKTTMPACFLVIVNANKQYISGKWFQYCGVFFSLDLRNGASRRPVPFQLDYHCRKS